MFKISLVDKTAINFILFFVMLSYLSSYLLFISVDPYQLRKKGNADWNKYTYTRQFSRFHFDALYHNNYSLIFGSSRIHKLSSRLQMGNYLNFHHLYSEPGDIKNFITQLSDSQLQNIDVIYFELDISAFRQELFEPIDYNNNRKMDIFLFTIPLSIEKLYDTFRELIYNLTKIKKYKIENDGSLFLFDEKPSVIPKNPTRQVFNKNEYGQSAIKEISDIMEFCKENSINIIFHTPTYTDVAIKNMNWDTIELALADLLNKGVKFKNNYFIKGISDVHSNNTYPHFNDATHLNSLSANEVFKKYVKNDGGLIIDDIFKLKTSISSLRGY